MKKQDNALKELKEELVHVTYTKDAEIERLRNEVVEWQTAARLHAETVQVLSTRMDVERKNHEDKVGGLVQHRDSQKMLQKLNQIRLDEQGREIRDLENHNTRLRERLVQMTAVKNDALGFITAVETIPVSSETHTLAGQQWILVCGLQPVTKYAKVLKQRIAALEVDDALKTREQVNEKEAE